MSASTGQTNIRTGLVGRYSHQQAGVDTYDRFEEIDSEARARRDYAGHVPIANRGVTTQLH